MTLTAARRSFDFLESARHSLKSVASMIAVDLEREGFSPGLVPGQVTIHGGIQCLDDLRDSINGHESLNRAVAEMKERIRIVDRKGTTDVIFPNNHSFQFVFTSN